MPSYRKLDSGRLIETAHKIVGQVDETFPNSGLAAVAHSFENLAEESISKARNLKVPIWKVRLISAVVIAFVLVWIVAVPFSLNLKDSVSSWSEYD